MKTNIKKNGRRIRVLIAFVLIIAAAFAFSAFNYKVFAIGIILLATGAIGFCPIVYYFNAKKLQ